MQKGINGVEVTQNGTRDNQNILKEYAKKKVCFQHEFSFFSEAEFLADENVFQNLLINPFDYESFLQEHSTSVVSVALNVKKGYLVVYKKNKIR